MNKKGFQPTDEDKLIEARVNDAFLKASSYIQKFYGFLDPHEAVVAKRIAEKLSNDSNFDGCSFSFFGGYQEAERVYLGVFVPYSDIDINQFPIKTIKISWKFKPLSHRDFLGALLSLGIVKSKIGDILVRENDCTVFIDKTVADFVIQNLNKVGSCGVKCEFIDNCQVERQDEFREIKTTIASERLDCVVSALTNTSRTASNLLITSGLVSVNYEICTNNSFVVIENSTVSIRGHGRFAVLKLGPKTRKGRLSFTANKYI